MFTLIKSFVSFQNLHVAQQQEESCFALTQEDNWETFESSSARKQQLLKTERKDGKKKSKTNKNEDLVKRNYLSGYQLEKLNIPSMLKIYCTQTSSVVRCQ